MRLLIIDNYDSFTYNLYDYFIRLGVEVEVHRNDGICLEDVANFDRIVLSPGPGLPKEAGMMPRIIATYAERLPILGICLGHQAISEHFGGRLINLKHVLHGQQLESTHSGQDPLFEGVPRQFLSGHYHSWVVDPLCCGEDLKVIAHSAEGQIMALRHCHLHLYGIQFHPESIMTPNGLQMLENWLAIQ